MTNTYYATTGGHPAQTELTTNRAVFTEAYAVLPRGTMRDIVTSLLPFWDRTRLWVIARPLSGLVVTGVNLRGLMPCSRCLLIEAATVFRDTVSPPSRRSARIRGAP